MWKRLWSLVPISFDPEGHDLHVAAGAGGRHGVFAEAAFDLDQAEHQLRVESGTGGFVMHVRGGRGGYSRSGMRRVRRRTSPSASRPFSWIDGTAVPARRDRHRRAGACTLAASGSYCCAPAKAAAGQQRNCGKPEDAAHGSAAQLLLQMKAFISSAATMVASASLRPLYSSLPSFRPRSPTTTRCGTPISSMSANIDAGALVAVVEDGVDAGRQQFGVKRVGGGAHGLDLA
jgi:hypothetical protein